MPTSLPSLSDALREETGPWHDRLETLPFARDLAGGRATTRPYTAYLQALVLVHSALDDALASSTDPAVLALAPVATPGRVALLRADLDRMATPSPPGPSTPEAILVAEEIRRRARDEPTSLVGFLYVLEGSALGGLMLADLVARALGPPGDQAVSYLRGAGRATQARWQAFRAVLNALPLSGDRRRQAIEGAISAFAGLHHVFEALGRHDARPLGERP